MADNIAVTPGSGATVAADDIGGVLYQRVKIGVGADGSATDVSTAAPLPVSDAGGSLTVDGAVAATQSGSWAVTSTPDNVSAATVTQVSSSASTVQLVAANASRKGLVITNDSTAVLYVKLGTTASTSSYSYKLTAGQILELPVRPLYTGRVDGIWASANGAAVITEL